MSLGVPRRNVQRSAPSFCFSAYAWSTAAVAFEAQRAVVASSAGVFQPQAAGNVAKLYYFDGNALGLLRLWRIILFVNHVLRVSVS